MVARDSSAVTRRRLLWGLVGSIGTVAVGVTGFELVNHGVLPGKRLLDQIDGACSVPATPLSFSPLGPSETGTFYSAARRRTVGYTIAYPPRHRAGDRLALVVMLHGFTNDHTTALFGMSPAQALALRGATPGRTMAMVTVDGGNGYWNPHPGDDPMTMVLDELIPLCQRRGLGAAPHQIGLMGISMGGYGALAIAERRPELFSAVAVISPAVWTSYEQARAANAGAFASRSSFGANDVIAHSSALRSMALRIASGADDPFHPGVEQLVAKLGPASSVTFPPGCHTASFFTEQEPPSLAFLSRHLA